MKATPTTFSSRDLRLVLRHENHPALDDMTPAQLVRSIVREMRDEGHVFDADQSTNTEDR